MCCLSPIWEMGAFILHIYCLFGRFCVLNFCWLIPVGGPNCIFSRLAVYPFYFWWVVCFRFSSGRLVFFLPLFPSFICFLLLLAAPALFYRYDSLLITLLATSSFVVFASQVGGCSFRTVLEHLSGRYYIFLCSSRVLPLILAPLSCHRFLCAVCVVFLDGPNYFYR